MNPLRALWMSPTWLNRLALLLSLLGLASLLGAALVWLTQQDGFRLSTVEVIAPETGLRHVLDADIREALERGLAGSALATPLSPIRDALDDHPWIQALTLRRVWPNRLLIQIREHEPVAAWRDGRLVNRQGDLFNADRAWAQEESEALYGCRLVELSGPEGTHSRVLARASQAQQLIERFGLSLYAVSLSEQYAWQIQLLNGPVLALGQDELPTPWDQRLSALGAVLQRASAESRAAFVRVDLRYANGFAFIPAGPGQPAPAAEPMRPNCLNRLTQGRDHAA